ncbi:enoyl-[acyl-carrier-protein] reductase, mitochondrial [Osmerus eperlanus]|uniref:enoyl-[acyl-carrier-protein] reductase, mitochondrial n=1 Tax=Osmerus eperlanus TaxID=29151 RepID=UPI002E0F7621
MRRVLVRFTQGRELLLGQRGRQAPGPGIGAFHLHHTCSALVYRHHGDLLDLVRMEQMSLPALGPHSIRLKMLAAPINPADINMLQGTYPIRPPLPSVGGNEGVGEVVEVGSDVINLRPGNWAIPWDAGFGTWRTEVVCEEEDLLQVPRQLSVLEAATVAVNPCTAYRMLHDVTQLSPGSCVIQNGANSAVGQAVIQIASTLGLKTINIIRDRANQQEVKEELKHMGADLVVTEEELYNGRGQALQGLPRPVLGLNCVGGRSGGLVLAQLREGATMVTYGGMSRKPLLVPTGCLIFNNLKLRGFWMTQWKRDNRHDMMRLQNMVTAVCGLLLSGKLRPPRCVPVPFSQYRQALQATSHAHSRKHVLMM